VRYPGEGRWWLRREIIDAHEERTLVTAQESLQSASSNGFEDKMSSWRNKHNPHAKGARVVK